MKRKIVVASNLLEKKNYGDYTFPIDFDYNTLFAYEYGFLDYHWNDFFSYIRRLYGI